MRYKVVLVTFILMAWSIAAMADGVVLIANSGIGEESLSQKDVQAIFLNKKKSLLNGKIKIAIQKNAAVHEEFLKTYVKKSPSQFKSYYKKLIFTGKGKAPKSVADDNAMLVFVASTPGALGYVSEGSALDQVKIIKIQ